MHVFDSLLLSLGVIGRPLDLVLDVDSVVRGLPANDVGLTDF